MRKIQEKLEKSESTTQRRIKAIAMRQKNKKVIFFNWFSFVNVYLSNNSSERRRHSNCH